MIEKRDCEYVSEKDVFRRIIILECGPNKPVMCRFAQELLDQIPSYFWSEGASSSGNHHPSYSNGEGGLARHSLMVYRWMKELYDDFGSDGGFDSFNEVVAVACLFHDCCKRGLPDNVSEHTVHEHPVLAAKFILDKGREFAERNKDFIYMTSEDEDSFMHDVGLVSLCVASHMGKWNTSTRSEVVLPKPKSGIEQIVHLADYLSSRKYTTFDNGYFSELMREN